MAERAALYAVFVHELRRFGVVDVIEQPRLAGTVRDGQHEVSVGVTRNIFLEILFGFGGLKRIDVDARVAANGTCNVFVGDNFER